ncbi:MAG: leucyl aminopeptidase [bacterium]|nr:leucyl aminopeptidase [bacterium]
MRSTSLTYGMTGTLNVQRNEFPGTGEALIYIAFEDIFKNDSNFKLLNDKTNGKLLEKCKRYEFEGKEDQIVFIELDSFYKLIVLVGAGKRNDFNLLKWRNCVSTGLHTIKSAKLTSATLYYWSRLGTDYFEIGKNVSIAFYLTNYLFKEYKGEEAKKKITYLKEVNFVIDDKVDEKKLQEGLDYGMLVSKGTYLSRDLVNRPASHQGPESLVETAFEIEKESKGTIKVEVLDRDECKRLGMGSFLGVAQGSEKEPKFIVLHFDSSSQFLSRVNSSDARSESNRNSRKNFNDSSISKRKRICLIGKSIIFDSGGLSLKPSNHMETMKMDMAGGATVLGVFRILANIDNVRAFHAMPLPEIYGILPACENMPSGKALRPGDVLKALNNKTIEVLNTDAEGRLTLADALAYAEKYIKPDVMIDLATLTGACMVALGRDITGMFGNDEKLLKSFEQVAKQEGEELWKLPLHKGYAKLMKSDIADLKNVTNSGYGGAITAALFLSEFVTKAKWIHLDIAGPAFNETSVSNIIPKGGTGWGVLTLIEFLKKY